MSNQLALLHIYLACQYLAPLNYPSINNITYGTRTTPNELGTLNLYLACKSLEPLNRSCINITDFGSKPQKFTAKLATELPQGYAVFPDIGIAYKFYRNKKTWDEAKEHCAEEGGNLAVIDSFKKAEYVMALKGSTTAPDIHVGMYRLSADDEYVDILTGSPPAMIPWFQTEQISDRTRECIVIPFSGGGVVASHCWGLFNYVCEISMFKK